MQFLGTLIFFRICNMNFTNDKNNDLKFFHSDEKKSTGEKKLLFGKKELSTKNAAFIMGIVNCTLDSFYSESRGTFEECVKRAFSLIEEGADILDLGAESTRPSSSYVCQEEELDRLIPVLREIRKKSDIPISIDTRKALVMKAAFEEGADLLNDVSALEDDSEMGPLVAFFDAGVILMHKKGNPQNMQENIFYENVFDEVDSYLKSRIAYALECGIDENKIIIDPGIGFGKNLEQNKILVSRAGELCYGKYPVLMALSRKSFLGEITGRPVEERLAATIAANLISVKNGADIVRVHDIPSCRDTLLVLKSFMDSALI